MIRRAIVPNVPRRTRPLTRLAWNALLVVFSLAAGLGVCEAALRLADTRYEQIAEPPVRQYRWANTRPHPDAKTAHKVLYNRYDNRQHRDFSERDLRAGVHIAFFGDSFTEGREIPVQYTFPEVLDHLLNAGAGGERRAGAPLPAAGFHVHNFGVYGAGPGSQYLRYRGFAHKERLRHVFYIHWMNDFPDLRHSGLYALGPTGELVRQMHRQTSVWVRFLSGLRLTYLALDVYHRLAGTDDVRSGSPQAVLDGDLVFEALFSRWRDEAEANGSTFHIVLLPEPETAAQFRQKVRPELFDVFDLRDCFEKAIPGYVWDEWLFQSDGHWHEGGQMVAAHCLYRFLENLVGLEPVSEVSDEALAQRRYVYYRAFADDDGWQGHRFMPSRPWAVPPPGPVDAAEAARIRAKYLALESDSGGQRHRIISEVRQGEPVVRRGGWAVYASPRHRLIVYVKSPCDEDTINPHGRLFLHAFPVNLGGIATLREHEEGFLQIGFHKESNAASWRDGDECVVTQSVREFVLAKLHTGEYGESGVLWEAEFPFDPAEQVAAVTAAYRRDYKAFANTAPQARSHWNIHVLDGRLAFLKAPCDAGDLGGSFFLRLFPAHPGDAADELTPDGFVRREAGFWTTAPFVALRIDGRCLFSTRLPKWRVVTISAGQWASQREREAPLWKTTFHLDVERHRRAWAAVRSKSPTAADFFDVHRRDADIVYVREPCDGRDTVARFFLHLFAGGSRTSSHFDFEERGVVADGRCVAVVPLPEQDLDRIYTGQFIAGQGTPVWDVEF